MAKVRRSTSTGKRPTTVEYKPDNILSVINNTSMIDTLPDAAKNGGIYFVMELGYNAPANWDPTNNDYYWWNNNAWEKYNGTDRTMKKGSYIAIPKSAQNPSGTTPSNPATNNTIFNGLDLGFNTPQATAAAAPSNLYNYRWYLNHLANLNEYQNLNSYDESIRNRNLSYSDFLNLLKFLNPSIYNGMDLDNDNNISIDEYDAYMNDDKKKSSFYNNFSSKNWLNPLGNEYYTFFKDKNGLAKIQAYNDHLRMLYGNDLAENTGDDNSTAKLYFKDAPAYAADDRYKLARAYNEALQAGDYNTAKRLSLYMTNEGINHYGYHDHFDLNHLRGRWNRKLSNGKTVGDFLDWIYDYSKNNNVSSELINNIVRNATKYNFDLTTRFWNNLGPEGAAIRDAYAAAYLPTFKQGGQIFRMLFV